MSKDIIEMLKGVENLRFTKPATIEEISAAEQKLGLKFADDYIKCLLHYGVVFLESIDLMGITDVKYASVVHNTIQEKSFDCHSQVPSNMYVIENVGIDGLLVWQDESGVVYHTLPWQEPEKYANSLAEYIEKVLSEE